MCGLFGISTYGEKTVLNLSEITQSLAAASAIRGTDATGIAYNSDGRLTVYREPKSAYEIHFRVPKKARTVMGHTRHTTQGSAQDRINNHPFPGRTGGGFFALAHNGILANDAQLRKQYKLPKTKVETDSYVAVQLLEQAGRIDFRSLKNMAEAVHGSFSFSVLDSSDNLYLVKGDSPLSVLHFPTQKAFAYASTDQILLEALAGTSLLYSLYDKAFEPVPIKGGEILKIRRDGTVAREGFALPDEYGLGRYCWWAQRYVPPKRYQEAYLDDLMSVAQCMGYAPEQIEDLLREGFSLEEIEDVLYSEHGM